MRSVALASLPMVTGGAFPLGAVFLGRLVICFNMPGTCGCDSWSWDDLSFSSSEGGSSVSGTLRFLPVWLLGPVACFVAVLFFFFGSVLAAEPSSSGEGDCSVPGDLRMVGIFFFFGRRAAWQGRMMGGTHR